jgi:hypothetical protein
MSARLTRRTLILSLTAAIAVPRTWAQARGDSARFQIEMLVFRQPGPAPRAAPVPVRPAAITSAGRVEVLAADGRWQLAAAREALARRGYGTLGHAAWTATVPTNGRTTARLEDVLKAGSPLAGTIALQRSQYLFLGVDIDYVSAADTVYGVRERRRVKFGERHYFDHPAYGAIAIVTPAPGESPAVAD